MYTSAYILIYLYKCISGVIDIFRPVSGTVCCIFGLCLRRMPAIGTNAYTYTNRDTPGRLAQSKRRNVMMNVHGATSLAACRYISIYIRDSSIIIMHIIHRYVRMRCIRWQCDAQHCSNIGLLQCIHNIAVCDDIGSEHNRI